MDEGVACLDAPQVEPTIIPPDAAPVDLSEALRRFDAEISAGIHWYRAALHAVGVWRVASETYRRRRLQYVVAREALDLVLVIERLMAERPDVVPTSERDAMRFDGLPPIYVPIDEFRSVLGPIRYKAYLNYFYGVTVEEAAVHAVELEVSKAHTLDGGRADAYRLIYGVTLDDLLGQYRADRGIRKADRIRWDAWKEFTYWCFKTRSQAQIPARMASDTRKGISLLQRLHLVGGDGSPDPLRPDADPDDDSGDSGNVVDLDESI